MFYEKLQLSMLKNNSVICVGLDPLLEKIPSHLRKMKFPLFEFCREIIDQTYDLVCAYKPQIAYFSSQRAENQLEMIIEYIKSTYPDLLIILDAKRSDIDSTANQYAVEAFDRYKADALTVVPFQGSDAIAPYLERKDKGIFLLCKTSNSSSYEIQDYGLKENPLYMDIAKKSLVKWNYNKNIALVIGMTQTQELRKVRELVGDSIPFLIPGFGTQGGDLVSSVKHARNSEGGGIIISSSRSILYAGSGQNFANESRNIVEKLRMNSNFARGVCCE